ncbi:hypothetical protein PHISCL_02207 [Aspergillus sclerotialis]|uniref:Uncharacterized protein n=1 Tax=Aspergillus sclerotialis TaxID=2070753 RepID=A0A3A3A7V8_9EURO|nr:hypothetical protein PHISCL_02207 [Aspergillus sclerotialis]
MGRGTSSQHAIEPGSFPGSNGDYFQGRHCSQKLHGGSPLRPSTGQEPETPTSSRRVPILVRNFVSAARTAFGVKSAVEVERGSGPFDISGSSYIAAFILNYYHRPIASILQHSS